MNLPPIKIVRVKPLGVKPGGWLDKMIKDAQAEMETWPQWMKDAATFEGSNR